MIHETGNIDLKRIEEIWYQESVRVHNWMDNPNSFWENRLQVFKDNVKQSKTKLVYEEDDIIKGFVLKYENNYIPEIFVDHNYRTYHNAKSKEIGRILIDSLKDSNSNLTASVYMLNHKAIKFYIKNDFVMTKLYTENGTGFAKLFVEWKK